METLDITYISDLFYPYLLGGGERQFYEISRRMARKHNVSVLTLKLKGEPDREEIDGMEIKRIGFHHPLKGRNLIKLLGMIPAFFEENQIVHANQGLGAIRGIRGGFVTIHDLYFGKWSEYAKFPIWFFGRLLEKINTVGKSHIITVSNFSKKKIMNAGVSEERISVIPNGIEVSKYRSRKKEKTVLYVGRLVNYKRVDQLIEAFLEFKKNHPEYVLKIIGDGPMRKELERRYTSEDILFLGFVSEERKIDELSRAEIFANPSEIEGFGIVVLEAMASGCKIVLKPLPCYDFVDEAVLTRDFVYGLEEAWSMKRPKYDVSSFDWDEIVKKLENLYLQSL